MTTFAEQIQRAETALGITIETVGRRAAYRADETGEWYWLTRADLAYAVECAAAYPASDAYSHWCAGSGRPMSARMQARLS